MGACLLHKVFVDESPVECTEESECEAYMPTDDAWTGGTDYCLAPTNTGTKFCYVRKPNALACAGSPALAGAPISEGTYLSEWNSATDYPYSSNASGDPAYTFVVQACYQGCATTPPSISIETTYVPALGRWQ
jgi:hypothetical protein